MSKSMSSAVYLATASIHSIVTLEKILALACCFFNASFFDSATHFAFGFASCFAFALGAGTVAAAAREAASACSLRDPFSSSMPSSRFVSIMPLRDLSGPCTSTLIFPTLLAQAHRDAASGQESCAHCDQLGVWLRKSVNYRYRATLRAHPSPRDITIGVLLSIASRMRAAGQKQRPTTSLRLNVSTSTTRKLMPSPIPSLFVVSASPIALAVAARNMFSSSIAASLTFCLFLCLHAYAFRRYYAPWVYASLHE